MSFGDYLHQLETRLRGLAEKPLQGDRHPLALAHAILDDVEARAPSWRGRGRLVVTA